MRLVFARSGYHDGSLRIRALAVALILLVVAAITMPLVFGATNSLNPPVPRLGPIPSRTAIDAAHAIEAEVPGNIWDSQWRLRGLSAVMRSVHQLAVDDFGGARKAPLLRREGMVRGADVSLHVTFLHDPRAPDSPKGLIGPRILQFASPSQAHKFSNRRCGHTNGAALPGVPHGCFFGEATPSGATHCTGSVCFGAGEPPKVSVVWGSGDVPERHSRATAEERQ